MNIKPTILYHGSDHKSIKKFYPEKGNWQNRNELLLVFATHQKELALAFMRPKNGSPVIIGSFNKDKTWFIAIADKDKFLKNDQGGAAYLLPPTTFSRNPHTQLGQSEYISSQPVIPVHIEKYNSTLKAILQAGIQVYFTNEKINQAILKAKDRGYSILKDLKSENQIRGINPKDLRNQ